VTQAHGGSSGTGAAVGKDELINWQ